jgi:NDP-sugar pyrophosphorylase family protein/aminoglycoside/choline kinase family phosphotransferase
MSIRPIKTAFILGAGLGTRLRPLTNACPKPLLPVGDRPIITYAMDHLIAAGIERFIINTHHCADVYNQVFPAAQWRGLPIVFRHEPVLLDTAGGLKNIEDILDEDDTILVYNGDIISNIPLKPLMDTHFTRRKEATLALRSSGSPLNVNINDRGDVCDLRHILGDHGMMSCLFTGIYIVEKSILRRMETGRIESIIPVFIEMIKENPESVAGVLLDDGRWHDIGSLGEYEKICSAFSQAGATKGLQKGKWISEGFWQRSITNLEDEMLAFAKQAIGPEESASMDMKPVAKGGSNRSFYRIHYGDNRSVIFMHYDLDPEENNYYASIASFLRNIGVAAPRIMAHDSARGFIVMEDLGNTDLWSIRHEPWKTRQAYYQKSLAVIHRLHAFPMKDFPSEQVPLMGGFGPALYRWERDYFLDNFVQAVCGIEFSPSEKKMLEDELMAMSARLENVEPRLVHRDLQSRNIMILGGEPVLIDVQGIRSGNLFYDLGSLLYDPYVFMTENERMALLLCYYERQNILPPPAWSDFQEMFREASAQRLMQALGAYGFLGLKRRLSDFLTHIPNGLANLVDATSRTNRLSLLNNLARKCADSLPQDMATRQGPFIEGGGMGCSRPGHP